MPILRQKDTTHLIARTKIRATRRKHYLFAYLWQDRESMHKATRDYHPSGTQALHIPNTYSIHYSDIDTWEDIRVKSPPLLGEVHFVQNQWTGEIVAHELCHALLHRLRAVGPPVEILASQDPMDAEEALCYEFGQWFCQLYAWLQEADHP